jgi:2-polyprenyl-6-hydroxyphenyl methylase/3-demethylubiquinone-9 3-methyltransferase
MKRMFKFGENWASFSRQLNEERIEDAMRSLVSLFGEEGLRGRSFIDIGCGSGLFSIAAAKLGCRSVLGIDADPVSVQVSRDNAVRWLDCTDNVFFLHASILDEEQVGALGQFDLVYSWGVLHHTGSMWRAIQNAASLVKPGGKFMIAIYNRHWSSGGWWMVKRLYNHSGRLGQKFLIWVFTPIIFVAKWLVSLQNPFRMRRGMDFMHNVVDWVGGYPYEYASVDEVSDYLRGLGFDILEARQADIPIGCNEFVCKLAD